MIAIWLVKMDVLTTDVDKPYTISGIVTTNSTVIPPNIPQIQEILNIAIKIIAIRNITLLVDLDHETIEFVNSQCNISDKIWANYDSKLLFSQK